MFKYFAIIAAFVAFVAAKPSGFIGPITTSFAAPVALPGYPITTGFSTHSHHIQHAIAHPFAAPAPFAVHGPLAVPHPFAVPAPLPVPVPAAVAHPHPVVVPAPVPKFAAPIGFAAPLSSPFYSPFNPPVIAKYPAPARYVW